MVKFIKFLAVGGLATAIQYGILILLVETYLALPVVASSIGYLVSSIANYLLNYYFTFSSSASHSLAIIKFVGVVLIGLLINSFLVFVMTEIISIYYIIAQIVATLAVLIWNFFAHKYWTYKSHEGS